MCEVEFFLRGAVKDALGVQVCAEVLLLCLAGGGEEYGFFVQGHEVHEGGVAAAAYYQACVFQHGQQCSAGKLRVVGDVSGYVLWYYSGGAACYKCDLAVYAIGLRPQYLFQFAALWLGAGEQYHYVATFVTCAFIGKAGEQAHMYRIAGQRLRVR